MQFCSQWCMSMVSACNSPTNRFCSYSLGWASMKSSQLIVLVGHRSYILATVCMHWPMHCWQWELLEIKFALFIIVINPWKKNDLTFWCFFVVAPAKPVLDRDSVSRNETSLTIHWSVQYNGGRLTNYTVRWWSTASSALQKSYLVNQQVTWVLNNLVKGTEYSIEIEATNTLGSNTSKPVQYTTACCEWFN